MYALDIEKKIVAKTAAFLSTAQLMKTYRVICHLSSSYSPPLAPELSNYKTQC
jgi:hypothetical protein